MLFRSQSNCIYTLRTVPSFSNDTLILTEILTPCFTRNASWVLPDSKQDSLLQHEQLHFDLCELYGRKFRKTLTEQSWSILHFDRQVNELFGKMWNEYRAAQDTYDEETQHGLVRDKQLEWMGSVNRELTELGAFYQD